MELQGMILPLLIIQAQILFLFYLIHVLLVAAALLHRQVPAALLQEVHHLPVDAHQDKSSAVLPV